MPLDREGKVWKFHNNLFEKETVLAGIHKHYVDSDSLDIDEYLLYAGLCQGLMLSYSLESICSKLFCSGSLFWMYNDCWGEIGWTIVDYELRRKIAYYFVKRTFVPLKLILRQQEDRIEVTAINDMSEAVSKILQAGTARFDGDSEQGNRLEIELPSYSRRVVHTFPVSNEDPHQYFQYVKPVSCSYLFEPELTVSNFRKEGDSVRFTVTSDKYAHAVHFNFPDNIRLNDEYFDLLPGKSRTVVLQDSLESLTCETVCPVCLG